MKSLTHSLKSIAVALTVTASIFGQAGQTPPASPSQSPSRTEADDSSSAGGSTSGHERAASRLYLQVGPAGVLFAPSARVSVGGAQIPGAGANVGGNVSVGAETGWFFTNSIAASVTLGIPPRANLRGDGSLAAFGAIGSARYGPGAATAHYHFTRWRAFQPYVGGGLNYTLLFSTKDGALSDLAAKNRFGPVLQAGGVFKVNRHWGVFMDLKKIFLATTVTGTVAAMNGAPARAELRLDPWIIHAGLSYRF